MKTAKKIAAGIMALTMSFGMASCGGSGSETDSSSMSEKKLKENQQEIVQRLADNMTDVRELENNEIKWFSFYDINPTASVDKEIGVDLALFQTKYNGKIKYIQTTWETKFDDLASLVMANDSPDFIGADDMDVFPKGAIKGMIDPIDDYIDLESPLWSDMKAAMDQFVYKDGHYVAISRVDPSYTFIYNKNVIADLGMDDPAELYKNGEWNWDTFCDMCIEFTDIFRDKRNTFRGHIRFFTVNIPNLDIFNIFFLVHCLDIIHTERKNIFIIYSIYNGIGVKLISESLRCCS